MWSHLTTAYRMCSKFILKIQDLRANYSILAVDEV